MELGPWLLKKMTNSDREIQVFGANHEALRRENDPLEQGAWMSFDVGFHRSVLKAWPMKRPRAKKRSRRPQSLGTLSVYAYKRYPVHFLFH
jgi:hypothetical protein